VRTKERAAGARTVADTAWLVEALQRMWEIRLFEEGMHRLFLKGEVHGTTHLSAGQEAVPVGVCAALRTDDLVAGTYRGHGHALAKGTELAPLAGEMLGRANGVCGGRAGSMNVIDLEHGLVGCFGIIGGSAAAAIGAALARKAEGGVAVCFFGDGATNHGYLHECLNFAKVHSLPVVFVCENNLYGEFTPWQAVTAGGDISGRVASYAIPTRKVDGNDVIEVREAADEAVERARESHEPSFLECFTYRHYGHSKSDPGAYRTKEEVAAWKERDPLILAARTLRENGVPEAEIEASRIRADERVEAGLAAALAAPFPEPATDAATEYAS
jgi:TPP-dependent pyruvate/acetoin dehydrogenase alpha subunit